MKHVTTHFLAILLSASSTMLWANSASSSPDKVIYADSRAKDAGQDLTSEEKTQAQHWKLSEKEWSRYQEIMSGRRGIWSPGLDPVTALGVHADTEEERIRYAELWIRLEYERTHKELAFERARMEAAKRLYPDLPAIKTESFIEDFRKRKAANHKQLALFVSLECSECDDLVPRLYQGLASTDRLDIYVASATDQEIRDWAAKHKVPPELVKDRVITLNRARLSDLLELGVYGGEPKLFSMSAGGHAEEVEITL